MTTYQITPSGDGVTIELRGVGEAAQLLLGAFGDCQAGRCSCPTDEYDKVDAMDLDSSRDEIAIRLHAKLGQEFDPDEIAACLAHTVSGLRGSDPGACLSPPWHAAPPAKQVAGAR